MVNEVPLLATSRLLLRPIEIADSPAVQAHFSNWKIVKHLSAGMPWPYPADGALRMLRDRTLPAVARGEEWAWAITLRHAPAQLIGMISLMPHAEDHRGYWLAQEWHGRGLMTEACAVTTAYWFETLGFSRLQESKAMANDASRRLSEKEGMRLIRVDQAMFVSGMLPRGIWDLDASEWLANRLTAGRAVPGLRLPRPLGLEN